MQTALYPGSFDPLTVGHVDIIRRAAAIFDRLIIAAMHNPQKPSGAFTIEARIRMIEAATTGLDNISVISGDGLLVALCHDAGAQVIIRGLRDAQDAPEELQMARLNRQIGGIDTVFLAASPALSHISASRVREIGRLGGDIRGMVPDINLDTVRQGLAPKTQ